MSKDGTRRSSQNFQSTNKKSSYFKARDKPKYKSGAKPKNRFRDSVSDPRDRDSPFTNKSAKRLSSKSVKGYADKTSKDNSRRKPKELFSTTCYECKRETHVPFKPTGTKHVYCRECFDKHRPQSELKESNHRPLTSRTKTEFQSSNKSQKSDYRKRRNSERARREDFSVICDKCNKETTVPFKPTSNKPVYCRECFDKLNEEDRSNRTTLKDSNQHVKATKENGKEIVERFGNKEGPYREDKRMHTTTCRSCEKEIVIPFKPRKGKLIYCQDCFKKSKETN